MKKTALLNMVETTATEYWNDSCSVSELEYAIKNGATGATTNPVIVANVLKKEIKDWESRILEIIQENPYYSEIDIAWQVIEEMGLKGAKLLEPIFEKSKGSKGRLSMQTNAQNFRDAEKMLEQALHFTRLAKNIQVKMPATQAGIEAIEEATYNGVSINATVSFTVSQAIAVAEAVERAFKRRTQEGKSNEGITPVCTLMIGRVEDWILAHSQKNGQMIDPCSMHWAGVAVFRQAWKIFQKANYKTKLLGAAYRHLMHWSELIGGDILHTIPYKFQVFYNDTNLLVKENISEPIPDKALNDLLQLDEFKKAYEVDGLTIDDFDNYGAVARTLRQFHQGYLDLLTLIEEYLIPNPDK